MKKKPKNIINNLVLLKHYHYRSCYQYKIKKKIKVSMIYKILSMAIIIKKKKTIVK